MDNGGWVNGRPKFRHWTEFYFLQYNEQLSSWGMYSAFDGNLVTFNITTYSFLLNSGNSVRDLVGWMMSISCHLNLLSS